MTDKEKELVSEFTAGLERAESAIYDLAQIKSVATVGALYTLARKASQLLDMFLGNENKEQGE